MRDMCYNKVFMVVTLIVNDEEMRWCWGKRAKKNILGVVTKIGMLISDGIRKAHVSIIKGWQCRQREKNKTELSESQITFRPTNDKC